jgi:hypothetical protein
MSNRKAQYQLDRRGEAAAVSATWGPLIDEGLREAKATLRALEAPDAAQHGGESREAWAMIGRAFQSSASALRALGS